MSKDIKIDVYNPESIKTAIGILQNYKKQVEKSLDEIMEKFSLQGVEIAKREYVDLTASLPPASIPSTGELYNSIQSVYIPTLKQAIIFVDSEYAEFVEFGTGVVGANNPHPDPRFWQYDYNNHGDDGWWYFNDQKNRVVWTKGWFSRPFMYNTYQKLKEIIEDDRY